MYFVYRFIDKSKNVIYVGKSKQALQQRFLGHLHLPDECYRMVKKIEYIECPTEADMSIKEIYYINKYSNNPVCFNVKDVTNSPSSIEFNDKWKMFKGSLPSHFSNSINFKKGYSKEEIIRYNNDGTVRKQRSCKQKGIESSVEGLTEDEVNTITDYLIKEIIVAENGNQQQIRFRNLVMFVTGVNLPIRTPDLLTLKYRDLFDEKNKLKPYSLQLSRFNRDITIEIPLRKVVAEVLSAYVTTYGLTYDQNADENLFQSRVKNNPVTARTWWKLLSDVVEAVGIEKNVGSESIRKTYGQNVYNKAEDKLNALVFLGELWGKAREINLIKFLNLTALDLDYNYYFGEVFSLCNLNVSTIASMKASLYSDAKNTLSPQYSPWTSEKASSTKANNGKRNKPWTKEEKLAVVNEYLKGAATFKQLGEKYGFDQMVPSRWVKAYRQYGEAAFDDI